MTIKGPEPYIETQFPFADTDAAIMFRSALERHVRRKKTSIRKLASELGYKQSTVLSHMASGRVPIPIERAIVFADHLDLARSQFLTAVMKQRHPDVLRALTDQAAK